MFSETTGAITVSVEPEYLDDQSDPERNQYVWAYHIRIQNDGSESVQLLNRRWTITDGLGKTQEVQGPGVIGEQPVLGPGESYEYSSGCPLSTPSGFMVGSYEMCTQDGRRFEVRIPLFSLDSPHAASQVH